MRLLFPLLILLVVSCGGSGGSSSSDRNEEREVVDSDVDGETGATQIFPDVIDEIQGMWARGCTAAQNSHLNLVLFGSNYAVSTLSVEGDGLSLSYHAYNDPECSLFDKSGTHVTESVEYIGEATLTDGTLASIIAIQVGEEFTLRLLVRVDGDTLYIQDFENDNALNYDDPFYRK